MLNSLVIKNFRMLEDFTVSKLGRVNLIVGKNNSGKSTVLEALRIYAGNANYQLLESIAISHDENIRYTEPKKVFSQLDKNDIFVVETSYDSLFTNKKYNTNYPSQDTYICIGTLHSDDNLFVFYTIWEERDNKYIWTSPLIPPNRINRIDNKKTLQIKKNNENFTIHPNAKRLQNYFNCCFIPTQFIPIDELADEWDSIVYTENEKIVIDALKIIISEFEHLVFVKNERSISGRVAKVKLANKSEPVPLKSLGDGMLRILQIAIKLVSAQGGFLLIDEFENGLHYSVQEKVWALLFEMAEKLDIQVFATTHSWDCIESFTKVAIENETTEGVLFRMGRSARKSNYGQIIATVFDKDELYNITQADVEIR